MMKKILYICVFISISLVLVSADNEQAEGSQNEEDVKVDEEKLEWAKGSLCGYCEYCKVTNSLIIAHSSMNMFYLKSLSGN